MQNLKNTHTHTRGAHSHANTVHVFWGNHTGASLSLSHVNGATQRNKILLLYSAVTYLNYSRAGRISKRGDKRPLSFWNRFCMFVLFPGRSWAGSACEKHEVIMFRSMERIISCVLFHPANHSNTSVLTSCMQSEHVCFLFPLFSCPLSVRFTFFLYPLYIQSKMK